MGKIYKDQTKLRLTVDTEADLTSATVFAIKCYKPDGTAATFTATCDAPSGGIIYYDFVTDDLDQAGDWRFWAYITWTADVVPGEAFELRVHNEGE